MLRSLSLVLVSTSLMTLSCVRAETPTAKKPEPSSTAATAPAKAAPTEKPASESPVASTPQPQRPETLQLAQKEPAPSPVSQVTPTATTAATEETPKAEPASTAAEQPAEKKTFTKEQILASPQWRRAMFEFNEWLSAQPIYTPEQVKQIKNQFNHRVAAMDAKELAYMLADMDAKFQVMSTPEAREARAWMAQYLSVMSDKKKAEVLKDVPNIATMTAAQLNAEIQKIIEKRQSLEDEQAAFQRGQAQQVANQIQTDRTNQQNYVRDWNSGPVAYSPYRSQSNVNQRLNNTPTGAGMGFYVSPLGGVGMTFTPSSW